MEKNHTIYILLSHSGSVFSKLISAYTRGKYSHVSIALDKDLRELYSFGRLKPYNPIIGGFVREDIINGTYGRFPQTRCVLYSLKVNEIQYHKVHKNLNSFKRESEKYGYNFLGLIGAMFHHPIQRRYSYFCSQFVSELLQNSDIRIIDKHPGLTGPMDFLGCQELEFVYEGYLNIYGQNIDEKILARKAVFQEDRIFKKM